MFFYKRSVPGLASISYIIGDANTKRAAVIDPVRDVEEYAVIADKNNLVITDILETHVHADFISGSKELKHRLGGTPTIHCSGMGGEAWRPNYADRIVHQGDEVILGAIRFRAVHTPGHTPEHILWEIYDDHRSKDIPWALFTGDLLFVGDVGRPDLLGEKAQTALTEQLFHSIFSTLSLYPDFVEIYPSHGKGSMCGKAIGDRESSTVGYERLFNPSLQKMALEPWEKQLMQQMPEFPHYFRKMKTINVEGPRILGKSLEKLKAYSPEELAVLNLEEKLIVDTRSKESFFSIHIPGSICLPLSENFSTNAGYILPYDKPIVLLCEEKSKLQQLVTLLTRVGFDLIDGYLEGGISSWVEAGLKVSHIEVITPFELSEKISRPDGPIVLDVRTIGEFSSGHIPNALHIPIAALMESIANIPRSRALAVVCRSGHRSAIAASILKNCGISDVINLVGGMAAWEKDNLPIE